MRKWLTGSLVIICGCGGISNAPTEKNSITKDLSLEKVSSNFSVANISISETAKVTLVNNEFQTPRRIEKQRTSFDFKTKSPDEVLTSLAEKTARALNPDIEFKIVSLRRGPQF